jgi:hypothetical protein
MERGKRTVARPRREIQDVDRGMLERGKGQLGTKERADKREGKRC